MNLAFYSAYTGANAHQTKLDAIANNIANINNNGYKAQGSAFQNLIYENYRAGLDVKQGAGARVAYTTLDFKSGGMKVTEDPFNFAIDGDGFFAVRNTVTGETYYTRSGDFQIAQWQGGNFYLTTTTGELVLDRNMAPIVVENEEQDLNVGVFSFAHTEGFVAVGNNLYSPGESNGAPTLNDNARLVRGSVEASNVEMSKEISHMVDTQRTFQMTLRMLQTADEIESTINNFR